MRVAVLNSPGDMAVARELGATRTITAGPQGIADGYAGRPPHWRHRGQVDQERLVTGRFAPADTAAALTAAREIPGAITSVITPQS